MSHALEHVIRHYGLLAIFATMILESCCIPLPSELIMTYAGFEASRGNLNMAAAVVAGVAGNLLGSLLAYYIGSRGGRPLLRKYGRYVLFSERHFEAAERFFAKRGPITVLVARILPAIRTFISLPAGFANMSRSRFALYTTIGCIPWVWLLTWIGYKLGQNWAAVEAHSTAFTALFALILAAAVIGFWVRHRRADA